MRILALVLAGCAGLNAFVSGDLRHAAGLGIAAREAGYLPSGDRWPECFQQLAEKLEAAKASLPKEGEGLATLAMRVHIRKANTQPVSAECAQVILQLEVDGLKLGASFLPGGGSAMSLFKGLLK